jgi:hypothetical protein
VLIGVIGKIQDIAVVDATFVDQQFLIISEE